MTRTGRADTPTCSGGGVAWIGCGYDDTPRNEVGAGGVGGGAGQAFMPPALMPRPLSAGTYRTPGMPFLDASAATTAPELGT